MKDLEHARILLGWAGSRYEYKLMSILKIAYRNQTKKSGFYDGR
jgi:hypothetical protein